jgi:hypothetical protein
MPSLAPLTAAAYRSWLMSSASWACCSFATASDSSFTNALFASTSALSSRIVEFRSVFVCSSWSSFS